MAELPTRVQEACFEVGIKFGSLYHQFAGTPVSVASAESLERAMAESIENQPHCRDVEVSIDREAVRNASDRTHGYAELTGTMLDCRIEVSVGDVRAVAELEAIEDYPEMRITELETGTS